MDTLHAPTVPSGPTSNLSQRNGDTAKLSFAELQRKKDDMEAELKALGSVLDSVPTVYSLNATDPEAHIILAWR